MEGRLEDRALVRVDLVELVQRPAQLREDQYRGRAAEHAQRHHGRGRRRRRRRREEGRIARLLRAFRVVRIVIYYECACDRLE